MSLELAGQIDYQRGSIVSRVILKKKSGSITLFAFDEGEELSEHTTPHDAFVSIVEGAARISISGKNHNLVAGDALVLPANEPHAVAAIEPFKMVLVMLRE